MHRGKPGSSLPGSANRVGLLMSAAVNLPAPPAELGAAGIPDLRQGAQLQQGVESARVAPGTDAEKDLRDVAPRGPQQHAPRWQFDPHAQYLACSEASMSAEAMETAETLPVQPRPKSITTTTISQWRGGLPGRFRLVGPTRQAFDGVKRGSSNRQHTRILGCGRTGVKCGPHGLAAKSASSDPGAAMLFPTLKPFVEPCAEDAPPSTASVSC